MQGIKIKFHGASSFKVSNEKVEFYLSEVGGHLAPVNFKLKHRWVSPFSLPPWEPHEVSSDTSPIDKILRGDFFCFPFGLNKGIPYVHGDAPNLKWKCIKHRNLESIEMHLPLKCIKGEITKRISLNSNHCAIYQEHFIEGVQGYFNYGHHAILHFPEKGGPYYINVSPFKYGEVCPIPFSNPAVGEYSALKIGAKFKSLAKVALANGGFTSLHEYPARAGFEDLAMVSSSKNKFAWTAATLDGYVWFSLKNTKTLPSTIFWFTNGGRHQQPWGGRHRNRVGLEEVNTYFDSLYDSRKNPLLNQGISTTRYFSRSTPTTIRLIQAAHQVPTSFGMVTDIVTGKKTSEVFLINKEGLKIKVPLDWSFLQLDS